MGVMAGIPVRAPFKDCVRPADLKLSGPEQIATRSLDFMTATAGCPSRLQEDARMLVVGDVMLDRFRVCARLPHLAGSAGAGAGGGARGGERWAAPAMSRAISLPGRPRHLDRRQGHGRGGRAPGRLLAREPGIENALLTSATARTTEKIRYIAEQQQVMRADYGNAVAGWGTARRLLAAARAAIANHDAAGDLRLCQGISAAGTGRGSDRAGPQPTASR